MNKTVIGHIGALISVIIWGTTFVSTKILLKDFAPLEILFLRFVMGFLALTAASPKRMKTEGWKEERWYMLAGISGVTLYYFMENLALTYTLASNVSVIVSSAPFFTALLAMFFVKDEKPKRSFFVGFVFAMAGIALISFQGNGELRLNPIGDLVALVAAFWWGIYSVALKKITTYNRNMTAVTKRIFFWGLVFMVPFVFLTGFHPSVSKIWKPVNLFNLVFLGLGASAFCFAAWNYAIERLGALKSSVYIYLVPVITLVAAYVILGERITLLGAAGTALTLLGLALSEFKGGKKNHGKK